MTFIYYILIIVAFCVVELWLSIRKEANKDFIESSEIARAIRDRERKSL